MEDDKYKVLLDEIKSVKEEVQATRDEIARVDRDLTKDREYIEDFRVRLGRLEAEVQSMKRLLFRQADKVKDRVEDVVQPAVKEVRSLKSAIDKKNIRVIRQDFWSWVKKQIGF